MSHTHDVINYQLKREFQKRQKMEISRVHGRIQNGESANVFQGNELISPERTLGSFYSKDFVNLTCLKNGDLSLKDCVF